MFRPLFAALLLTATALPAAAQEVWLGADAGVALGGGIDLDLESIARIGEDGLYETELGAMLALDAGGVELAGGYVRVIGYEDGDVAQREHRTRQQVSRGLGPVSLRLRFEQRFVDGSGDMGLRLRPRAKLSLPLPGAGVDAVLSHESFIELNDTDWGQDAGWRRMRNFVGLETPLLPNVALEAGYIHQFSRGRRGGADSADHVASLRLALDF